MNCEAGFTVPREYLKHKIEIIIEYLDILLHRLVYMTWCWMHTY